eukprot:CAMPEP_0116919388 /NCGR_PEP_ID=MMETSP0467-20121206/20355_1 /TAXON_ID=283647 /ORGANISM="Mesodinium pulex, Strain SPMC105" /LENGTH=100 /DNA_ID=CAMNT_0004596955 /DNA_START=578 /DNA_END=880 /DNA_ORIENTATION=-
MRDEVGQAGALLLREVEVHVAGVHLEFVQNGLGRGAEDVVDFVDLVEFVRAREEWEQGQHFEQHAAYAPDVHLVVVVAVSQQTLGRSLPAGGDLLGEGRV